MGSRRWHVAAVIVSALLAAPGRAVAHDISRSESKLQVSDRDVTVTLTLNLVDFHQLPDIDANHDGRITFDELDRSIDPLWTALRQHFAVTSDTPPIQTRLERYAMVDATAARLDVMYRFAEPVTSVRVESTLDRICQPDHRHLTSVAIGGAIQEAVLDTSTPAITFRPEANGRRDTFVRFARLGITHIFTGYDHLAFLVGLLIATTTFRSLVGIVTSFTIAHSVTLALATVGAVTLPSRLVESLIAVSIAYVAIENLVRREPAARYRVTFLFGLIHGFGFSTVLRAMDLPRSSLALSLFSFNAGVEIGQLLFVAAVFPLLSYLGSLAWQSHLRPAISASVAGLAIYWFVQRAFLG